MADGLTTQTAALATIPDATKVATDDAGAAGHVQIIKLAIGTDGSASVIPADAANGLDVDVTRLPALAAGTNVIGKVRLVDADGDEITVVGGVLQTGTSSGGTSNARVASNSAGLTTSTTAYVANDQIGTIIELTGAVASNGGFGTIVGATLLDKAPVVGAVSAYLFDRSVTLASDNAQADFSDSDMENCLGIIEFPPPAVAKVSSPSNAIAQVEPLALPIKSNATSLWVALVTRSGHTFFGSATDLRISLIIEQS